MRKILIILLFICSAAECFAQSQYFLEINHNRLDFHAFREDSVPANTWKFYNESNHSSPIVFFNLANEEKVLTLLMKPFSYAETPQRNNNNFFDITQVFGEITVQTDYSGLPVRTLIGDDIIIDNGISKISMIVYPNSDIYITAYSGKATVRFRKSVLLLIAGETAVLHIDDGSYDYIDNFDYDTTMNRIISKIVSDRTVLSNDIRDKMSSFDDTSSAAYRRLWVTRRFLEEY